ncbi:hypothetical protein L7F22_028454 [Adiantum nelumboides]|nr:hypothetical protein [Adiantum nelumboides]
MRVEAAVSGAHTKSARMRSVARYNGWRCRAAANNITAAAGGGGGDSEGGSGKLLSEVHRVIIPAIPCSIPWRNHPDYKQLTAMSNAWVLANFASLPGAEGRPATFAADHLIKSAFHMLGTLAFPTGLSQRMPPIIKMVAWSFMLDNILDDPREMGSDPARAHEVVKSILSVFDGTYHSHCSHANPLVQVLTDTAAEWWAELCLHHNLPPKQKARLRTALCNYLEASHTQIAFRNSRHLPNLETYFKLRADTVGLWACLVLIEYSQAFVLDDEVLLHPLVIALQEKTVQYCILVNDILSFKREYMQGDFCNVVSLLYFKNLNNPNKAKASSTPTFQGAMKEALQMIANKDEQCTQLMVEINESEALKKKPNLAKYLEGLGFQMSANAYWHLASDRYGICATPNLHITPPDMLAHHIINIKSSKEAANVVPFGVTM